MRKPRINIFGGKEHPRAFSEGRGVIFQQHKEHPGVKFPRGVDLFFFVRGLDAVFFLSRSVGCGYSDIERGFHIVLALSKLETRIYEGNTTNNALDIVARIFF